MKTSKASFVLSLIAVTAAFIVLMMNWNRPETWKFRYSLVGFILLAIIFLVSAYVTFFRKKQRD